MAYQGVDFYDIDELLTDEERTVRDTVRAWVSEKVIPIIEKHYLDGTFPTELIREMGEMGFLGANIDGAPTCDGQTCDGGTGPTRIRQVITGSLAPLTLSPVPSMAMTANTCLLYTSPSPRDVEESRMPSSA